MPSAAELRRKVLRVTISEEVNLHGDDNVLHNQMSELEEEIQRRQALGLPDDVDDIVSAIESDELEEFDDWDGDGEEGL
jgi:hypothetical protein